MVFPILPRDSLQMALRGQGTGHLVTLLGFDRDVDGAIVALRVRNPWGFDETIPAEQFREENFQSFFLKTSVFSSPVR